MSKWKNAIRGRQRILRHLVAVVLVLILSIGLLGCETKGFCMYTKDAQIWLYHLGGRSSEKLTNDFLYVPEEYNPTNPEHGSNKVNQLTTVDAHSQRVFYPTALVNGIYSLKYKNNGWNAEEAKLVASNIVEHWVDENAQRLIYRTASDELWRYDLDRSYELAKNIEICFGTKRQLDICYLVKDGGLYFQSGDMKAEEIDRNVDKLYGIDSNSTVYYRKQDLLYVKKVGEEAENIAEHVTAVALDEGNGGCYILTAHNVVGEDIFDTDLGEIVLSKRMDRVRFYDGSHSYPLGYLEISVDKLKQTEDAEAYLVGRLMMGNGRLCFVGLSENEMEELCQERLDREDISEYQSKHGGTLEDAVHSLWNAYLCDNIGYRIAVGSKLINRSWGLKDGFVPCMESGGDVFYYIIQGKNGASLHSLSLGEVLTDKMIAADIAPETLRFFASGTHPVYLVNTRHAFKPDGKHEGSFGELWIDEKKVAKEAYSYRIWYDEGSDSLYFLTEYDMATEMGVLLRYSKEKNTEIASNVYYYAITTDGGVVYLRNYDMVKCEGNLYLYQDGCEILLDTEVANIMQCGRLNH